MESKTTLDNQQIKQMALDLIAAIDDDNQEVIDEQMAELSQIKETELFQELGQLTRDFHDSLNEYEREHFSEKMSSDLLPTAGDRLEQVIVLTEEAAHKTLEAAEEGHDILEPLAKEIGQLADIVSRLDSETSELRQLKGIVVEISGKVKGVKGVLQKVILAQSYQDLSGQIVRKVVTLVTGIHLSLVSLLGEAAHSQTQTEIEEKAEEAPITSQEDVDALLASLGF